MKMKNIIYVFIFFIIQDSSPMKLQNQNSTQSEEYASLELINENLRMILKIVTCDSNKIFYLDNNEKFMFNDSVKIEFCEWAKSRDSLKRVNAEKFNKQWSPYVTKIIAAKLNNWPKNNKQKKED